MALARVSWEKAGGQEARRDHTGCLGGRRGQAAILGREPDPPPPCGVASDKFLNSESQMQVCRTGPMCMEGLAHSRCSKKVVLDSKGEWRGAGEPPGCGYCALCGREGGYAEGRTAWGPGRWRPWHRTLGMTKRAGGFSWQGVGGKGWAGLGLPLLRDTGS